MIKVIEVETVCVYCGSPAGNMGCCGEVHFETGYETADGELILESELTEEHEIVDDFEGLT